MKLEEIEGVDCGAWRSGKTYQPGDMVSHAGRMWYAASSATAAKPGSPDSGWVLAVETKR